MRIVRSSLTFLVALVLGAGLLTAAVAAPGQAAVKPERIITMGPTKQLNYNTFKVTGNVSDPATAKALLIRRKCFKCGYKKVKNLKLRDNGNFSVRFVAAPRGKWLYKIKVKGDDVYRATTGQKFGSYFD